MARKHGVPIFDSIEKALTLGGDRIAVDGVISIGEHGDYPWNDKEQHLYPRRRFFEEITATFEKCKQVVPVFNDKHLGPVWSDAKWMYDRARELKVPFMAGSSLPVTFRSPEIDRADGQRDRSGRRASATTASTSTAATRSIATRAWSSAAAAPRRGVKSVQCLQGDAMWKAVDDGVVSEALVEAALAVVPTVEDKDPRKDEQATLCFCSSTSTAFAGPSSCCRPSAARQWR